MHDSQLRTIAVDLTPLLPGGENGGAKIFVLELLRRLAALAPQTRFVLLTQSASHEELATLDSANVSRRRVAETSAAAPLRTRLDALAGRLIPLVPHRIRRVALGLGYRLHYMFERGASSTLLREIGADLLFCPFTAPTYFEPGIPAVCTIHDLQYATYPQFFAPHDVAQREHTFREAARRATMLAAVSDYSRDAAIRHGNLDPGCITTIHHRINLPETAGIATDDAVLDLLGLARHRYLVYPANFWKHKNHEALITAFGIACQNGLAGDVKLLCTGAPDARQEWLMNAACAMRLGDRVLFPGFLPRDQLQALMARSAGVIFPSLYEGFGLPIIEAMAAGVPVACSKVTSLPEVASEATILFDPRVPTEIADAMLDLVGDPVAREKLIASGRQRALKFADADRMAREYLQLFLDAIRKPTERTQLAGVYADGWSAGSLNLYLSASDADRTLELELVAPDWLPIPKVGIEALHNDGSRRRAIQIYRGTEHTLSMPLGRAFGRLSLRMSPTFVPSRLGLGNDSRELSLMVKRATIVAADGTLEHLYPVVRNDSASSSRPSVETIEG